MTAEAIGAAQATIATLDDRPLVGPVSWSLTSGVDPFIGELDLLTKDADRHLEGELAPRTLVIESQQHGRKQFQALYVLQRRASPNPNHARLVVADRRWFWRNAHVYGRFNIRRRIGTKRVGAPAIPELQPVVDSFAYAPWSTRDGTGSYTSRWTARQVLEEVLRQAFQPEAAIGGGAPVVNFEPWEGLDEIALENLEIDSAAPDALRRILAYIPEAEITLDASGAVRVYNRTSGAESGLLGNSIKEVQGRGHLESVDLRRVRPRRIHVLFTRECEVRFNALASGETTTQDDRYMDNVLPIPDYSLVVGGETLTQGTWITFRQAFEAWGTIPRVGTPLSDDICRLAFVPGLSLMAAIGELGKRSPDADWVGRMAAVSQHWRQTYRINRRWMDRIASLRANRVALIDPTTGQRAEAQAYTNYCVISTTRNLYLSQRGGVDGGHMPYAVNVIGYPVGNIDDTITASPFRVTVIDDEQGIVRFDHVTDPIRLREIVLPSMMELYGDGGGISSQPATAGPTANIKDQNRFPVTFDALTSSMRPPALTSQHKIATILTALMGAPNGKAQLHRVTIEPEQVLHLVPAAVRETLGKCDGPELEVRIGPAVETARVAWFDATSELTERAFGINVPPGKADEPVNLSPITVNQGDSGSGASLWNIASAQAASIWAALGDRVQGQVAAGFAPEVRVGGFLSSVRHDIASTGAVTTSMDLPEQVEPLDIAAYLDANTYRVIKRLVGPGGRQT